MPVRAAVALLCSLAAVTSTTFAQANGRLQIHFMNVGQGDAALLISPDGSTVLFDDGVRNHCDLPVSYLQQLGVGNIDYHIASHYHDDHIGCAVEVLSAYPLRRAAIDRGDTYPSAIFTRYVTQVGALRRTATPGMTITLDAGTSHPVSIVIHVVNGADQHGVQAATNNENDLSVVAVVHFGAFDAVFGGDLSGARTSSYRDVETFVASGIGQVEVYKVNHHGSSHSSNAVWLNALRPLIGIISAGLNSKHHHPTADALGRLHQAGVHTYWTTPGGGAPPQAGLDVVGNNIIVEAAPGSPTFTVTYSGTRVDTYHMIGAPAGGAVVPTYAWSTRSDVYHFANCAYVDNISPSNLARGQTPPAGKHLHAQCPRRGGSQ